jgi:Tol biopolymer transport system component
MTRVVLPAFLLPLLILSGNASAQVPKAEKVPAKAATPVSLSRSAVMEVPAGQDVRRISPDGAVITSQWESGEVTFTLHGPEGGSSTRLPFSPAVQKSEYRSVTEVRVDGPYVSFTDVRDPDIAIYNRQTQEVRRLTHPEGGRINDVSVSLQNGDVLYERREGPITKPRVYLWRGEESKPVLISDTETFRPQWAPSGNFFLLRKQMSGQEAGRGDEGSYGWWLYDSSGDPLLDLSRYGRPSQADWSPDSKKIALDVRSGRLGLFILYLGGNGQSIEVEQSRYIAPPEDETFFTPKWSPDGSKLAYIVEHIGDMGGARMELRILRDRNGTYQRYSAGVGSASTFWARPPWEWASPTTLNAAGGNASRPAEPEAGRQIAKVTVDL